MITIISRMHVMLVLALLMLLFVVPLRADVSVPITAKSTMTTNSASQDLQVNLLFVLESEQGRIAGNFKDGYTLTLTGVEKEILYFSDRPHRISGKMPASKLIDNWNAGHDSFANDHPNAAIIHAHSDTDKQGIGNAQAFELYEPIKIGQNTWKFKLSLLNEERPKVGTYQGVKLFIDSVYKKNWIEDRGIK